MADLLPSMSSDEEDNLLDDPEDDEGVEVNKDFVFGGILGEDGGAAYTTIISHGQEGWSYQKALDNLEKGNQNTSSHPPRMDIASLIAAKRKSLKKPVEEEEEEEELDNKENEQEEKYSEEESSDEEADENKNASDDSSSSDEEEDEDDQVDDADRDMEEDLLKIRMGKEKGEDDSDDDDEGDDEEEEVDDEDDEDQEEAEKAAKFFETQKPGEVSEDVQLFNELTLSRPLLRGIASMGYVKPTPIQTAVIPVALAGRDICASAVTGSGKTAAFLLPILERCLHRPPGRITALILTPTRELAAQCLGMMETLSQFTKIHSTLIVGGAKNVNSQIAELRSRPQVVVATPGRLLDHVMNSTGVTLEDIEFLVLDEADRLLDLGFQEEVTEIIKACPAQRQTLLFSATMNTKVDDLISLSMKRPVRVRVSDKEKSANNGLEVAPRLEQEFIRVRSGNEGINREGMLLGLLTRTFSEQTIVFFDTKAKAHRMMILCGLCGIKCAELHGNLTQTQRLEALENFRKGEVDVLLATDLAARGLDINRVQTVINFEMPSRVETYIHRIGRTARAGRGGRSCTLIGEGRRHLMKTVMKDAAEKGKSPSTKNKGNKSQTGVIRSRSIPAAVISHFVAKLQTLEPHVEEVYEAEAVAKMDRLAEMEANKAHNIIEHGKDITSRPQRQWFASEQMKQNTKAATLEKAKMIAEKVGTGTHRMTRKKRRKRDALADLNEDRGSDEDEAPSRPSAKAQARAHKQELQKKEMSKLSKSLHDLDEERRNRKKHKGASASDALGDSSLFDDEKIAYAKKKEDVEEKTTAPSSYSFRGFDPAKDGKKKPKQKANNKFKSKSKFKRGK